MAASDSKSNAPSDLLNCVIALVAERSVDPPTSLGSPCAARISAFFKVPIWLRRTNVQLSESPPPYRTSFCGLCGSQVPDPSNSEPWFEIPAGALDDDPLIRPDKHIYTEFKAPWEDITDDLPQMTKKEIQVSRNRSS